MFIPFCIEAERCIICLFGADVTPLFCRQWWTCCIGEICRGRGWCLEPVCSCCCPSACAVLSAWSPTWPLPCSLSPSPSGYTKAFYRLFRSQRMDTPSSEDPHVPHIVVASHVFPQHVLFTLCCQVYNGQDNPALISLCSSFCEKADLWSLAYGLTWGAWFWFPAKILSLTCEIEKNPAT